MNPDEERRLRDVMQQAEAFEQTEQLDRMRQPLSGQLLKFTNPLQGWQNRLCVLDPVSGELRYYLKGDAKASKPRGTLNLANAEIVPSEDDSLAFAIVPDGSDPYRFKAANTKLKQEWINRLRTVADDHTMRSRRKRMSRNGIAAKLPECPDSIYRGTGKLPAVISTLQKALMVATEQHASLVRNADNIPYALRGRSKVHQDILAVKSYAGSLLDGLKSCSDMLNMLQGSAALPLPYGPSDVDLVLSSSAEAVPVDGECQSGSTQAVAEDSKEDKGSKAYEYNPLEEVADEEEEAEESDVPLNEAEEGKIVSLLSRLKLGTDLTTVSLPASIFQRRSFLETCSNFFMNTALFLSIGRCSGPEERLIAVVKWYLSSFQPGCKGGICRKPFNAVLGEVFHCSWWPKESENGLSVQFCAEQVSHHPPVTCFYAAASDGSVLLNGSVSVKSKFMGMSVSMPVSGETRLVVAGNNGDATEGSRPDDKMNSTTETFLLQYPTYHARSILTTPWTEFGGKVQILSTQTNNVAVITFDTKSYYGSKSHWVSAELKTPSGRVFCKAVGDWRSSIEFSYASGQKETLKTAAMATGTRRIRPLDKQHPLESRAIWKDVVQALRVGDFAAAQRAKQLTEERQRSIDFVPTRNFIRLNDTTFAHKDFPAAVYREGIEKPK